MLNSTVEDLILFICDSINGIDPKSLSQRDRSIIFSIASQLKRSVALTTRQADLVLKIFRDNRHLYEHVPNFERLLLSPSYKYPFRVIDTSRKIILDETNNSIRVKFPFDTQLNKILDKISSRRSYDSVTRAHTYRLSESSILDLVDSFKDHNFQIDEKILNWYSDIKSILNNPDRYFPCADLVNESVFLINSNNSSKSYFEKNRKNNIITDAYLAKFMGLKLSPSLMAEIQSQDIDNLTKSIITSDKNRFFISSSSSYNKFHISCFLKEAATYPTIIFLNDDHRLPVIFKQWIISLNKNSVENKNISVLFRSDQQFDFNTLVKEEVLNNLVDEQTKVVFVKNKIPKILYKLNFSPKLILSCNSFYVHYTGQKLVDSHPLVLYYTEESNVRMNPKFAKL